MLSRRNIVLGSAALAVAAPPASEATPARPKVALAAQPLTAYLARLARNAPNQVLPPNKYRSELSGAWSEMSGQFETLSAHIEQLPQILDGLVRLNSHEGAAHLRAFKPQVDAVMAGAAAGRIGDDERARLNHIVVDLQIAADRIWQYGSGIYPAAASATALILTIHRLLGSPAVEVAGILDYLTRLQFARALDPGVRRSLVDFKGRQDQAARELRILLVSYPRYGTLAFTTSSTWQARQPGAREENYQKCYPVVARIEPATGLPDTKFSIKREKINPADIPPPIFPDMGRATACTSGEPRREDFDEWITLRLNKQLLIMKQRERYAQSFADLATDVQGVMAAFRQSVGLQDADLWFAKPADEIDQLYR